MSLSDFFTRGKFKYFVFEMEPKALLVPLIEARFIQISFFIIHCGVTWVCTSIFLTSIFLKLWGFLSQQNTTWYRISDVNSLYLLNSWWKFGYSLGFCVFLQVCESVLKYYLLYHQEALWSMKTVLSGCGVFWESSGRAYCDCSLLRTSQIFDHVCLSLEFG